MTAARSILDVMAEFFAAHPALPARALPVADPAWRFLRDSYAKVIRPEAARVMLDLPVHVSEELSGGQWQIREDGEVVESGDIAPAPEGMTVTYSPYAGWFAVRTDLAEMPVSARWEARW